MTVTFFPVSTDTRVRLVCICKTIKSNEIFSNPAEAYAFLRSPEYTHIECPDEYCNEHRYVESVVETPEMNISNINARFMLEALGYDTQDLMGSATAEDFAGRVLMALAISPVDEGIPTHDDSTYDANGERVGMQMISGGRSANYLQDHLEDLRTVSTWATENETTISWG